LDFSLPFPTASSFLFLKLLIMKSKILWQYTAILFLSIIFTSCKKDISQTEKAQFVQDEGLTNGPVITCIPNGIQFFKTEALSQARGNLGPLGIGLGNRVLFVGGMKNTGGFSARVDIYHTSSDSWTDKILSEEGKVFQAIAAGGTKIAIAGGQNAITNQLSDQVDIYDVNSHVWTISHLSVRRSSAAGVGYGDSLYFAGGFGKNNVLKSIDVYNTVSGTWSKLSMSLARHNFAAAATNNKILFAGGQTETHDVTDRVDIYDVHSGTWSVSALSEARTDLVGAALGNLIIFGGGFDPNPNSLSSDVIDIYNTTTGQWSVSHRATAAGWKMSAVQGTKMFFSGLNNVPGPTAAVDVYDICSNTWGELLLTDRRERPGVGAADGKVLIAGGDINTSNPFVKTVDIFNLGPLIQQ
jgi:Kelch motif